MNKSDFEAEVEFTFSRSSGSGGQNINKVNTKASMKWDIDRSTLINRQIKDRFKKKFSRYVFDGMVIIRSQKYRSQLMNRDDCLQKLMELLDKASHEPKKRKKTKPTRSSVEKRIKNKKLNSLKKQLRTDKSY